MLPKDKAEELVRKMCFNDCTDKNINKAKQYALVVVDEIINEFTFDDSDYADRKYGYWYEVIKEIKKI